ncbi:MAG TPA: hypothetical protein P5514_12475 [Bacteroidales bacterium]|nr:hypothetical protein [Bacteroidales bacterium]HRX97754.1 hypothetical protein [Bacteroidales bacterium]
MRDYIMELKKSLSTMGEDNEDRLNLIEWATKKADWIDPTTNNKGDSLEDFNPNIVFE